MATLHWLCRLDWSPRPLHWATSAVTITDELGVVRDHDGGLSVSFDGALELFSEGTSIPSVTLGPLMPPPDVDVAALVEAGHILDGAPMELALWWDDTDYRDRRVMVLGRARLPGYGAPGEPLEFGLEPLGVTDEGRILGPQEVVSAETWPFAREEAIGVTYPRVYGRPGMGREITRPKGMTLTSTFEAPLVQANTTTIAEDHVQDLLDFYGITLTYDKGATFLLLAGHPITAELMRVYCADDTLGLLPFDQPVTTVPDRLGHACAICETPTAFRNLDAYYVDYAHETDASLLALYPGVGGVRSRDRTGEAMYGAGEILLDLLTFSSVPVDRQAFNGVRVLLDRFRLDFFIDDPAVSPLEFIQSNLLPILPVSLVLGPRGLYPVMWLPDEQPVVATLTAGDNAHRVGLVEYEGDVYNEVSLAYAPNFRGDLMRRATITGQDPAAPVVTPDVDGRGEHIVIPSAYARASAVRHGLRAKTLESIVVYDEATAGAIVGWLARINAAPWRSIRYQLEPDTAYNLRLGDYVMIEDDDLSLDRRALVRSIAWTDSNPEVELLLIDGAPRGG